MSFGDSTGTWIRRPNGQVWLVFWNLIAFLRSMGTTDKKRAALFRGRLGQAISAPKRVGGAKGRGKVVWATGDAVLSRIGAGNRATRAYILEETNDFLSEITHGRRRIAIGDAEKLAATNIGIAWRSADALLLLGAADRNFLAWTKNGYAKNGAALILNQETSRLIAKGGRVLKECM